MENTTRADNPYGRRYRDAIVWKDLRKKYKTIPIAYDKERQEFFNMEFERHFIKVDGEKFSYQQFNSRFVCVYYRGRLRFTSVTGYVAKGYVHKECFLDASARMIPTHKSII